MAVPSWSKDGPTLPKLQVKCGKRTFNLNIRTSWTNNARSPISVLKPSALKPIWHFVPDYTQSKSRCTRFVSTSRYGRSDRRDAIFLAFIALLVPVVRATFSFFVVVPNGKSLPYGMMMIHQFFNDFVVPVFVVGVIDLRLLLSQEDPRPTTNQ